MTTAPRGSQRHELRLTAYVVAATLAFVIAAAAIGFWMLTASLR